MNNKHNSVLDVQQPPVNIEPVDTIEDTQQLHLPPSEHEQELLALINLPYNGCTCNHDQGIKSEGRH